jgi:hypothetical protein
MTLLSGEEPDRQGRLKVRFDAEIPWQPIKSHVDLRAGRLIWRALASLRIELAPLWDIRSVMRRPASNPSLRDCRE